MRETGEVATITHRAWLLAAACGLATLSRASAGQINPTLSEAERGIRVEGVGEEAHLRVDAMKVDAHVVGRTADVTIEMLIGSDQASPYEGKLSLLLPSDAVVTGYALDVGGRMIPGQLLEAPKARNVYEAEVRAGIDPGLAEVSGNRFTTRIYPIDREHPRRFRVSFAAPFDPATGIMLPLGRDRPITRLDTTVRVDGYRAAPTIRFAGKPVALTRDGAGWTGMAEAKAASLRDGLSIEGGALTGPIAVARHASGERFFVIGDEAPVTRAPAHGGRLRVYWDRSRSHRDEGTELEAEVLARLVDARAPVAIDLVTFASDRPRVTTLRTAADLRGALGKVTYRGATSLAGLDGVTLRAADACVLVSDGQVTIDKGAAFAPDCALSVLTASASADGARLGRMAQGTGGTVVRVAPDTVARAVAALSAPGNGVVAVRDGEGRRLDVRALPAAPGHWLLTGPMPRAGAVHVRLAGGATRTHEAASEFAADAPGALWATQAVTALADDPARHAAMADLARRYQVAGPGMSFLVLERPDQYLRAGIAPPRDFAPEWLRDYTQAKAAHDEETANAKADRLRFVLAEWRERRAWWQRRFVPITRAQQVKRADAAGRADQAMPPPPSAPMPAPPPAMEAPSPPALQTQSTPPPRRRAASDASDVVMTSSRVDPGLPRATQAERAPPITLDLADLLAKRPYLAALDAASVDTRAAVLAGQERGYGTVPTFYLDTAEWFRLHGDAATAEQLLLSALDLPTSDDETRQIVAFRLERDGSYDRAVELAEHLAAANAEFRPQPGRDLALALAARGRARGVEGRADLERAFQLLVDTALNPASRAFDGIEVIALMEVNALIPLIERAGGRWALDRRLVGLTDTDARVVIEWTADDADIDLWVDEPNGERVKYSNKLSSAGGQISNDMTDGYGPEEYAIHRAPPGAYRVRINGFDADRINPNGPGHVLIRLQRDFARAGEQATLVDADLLFQRGRDRDEEGDVKPIATLDVGAKR